MISNIHLSENNMSCYLWNMLIPWSCTWQKTFNLHFSRIWATWVTSHHLTVNILETNTDWIIWLWAQEAEVRTHTHTMIDRRLDSSVSWLVLCLCPRTRQKSLIAPLICKTLLPHLLPLTRCLTHLLTLKLLVIAVWRICSWFGVKIKICNRWC